MLGERILAPIAQLGEVRLIVRCAHEHYDGTGYPDRLLGDQIPLESRIVLACDAFHAMTTDRPYRKSLGADEAKRRLGRRGRDAVRSAGGRRAPPRAAGRGQTP